MKKYVSVLGLAISLFALNSCCTKKDCSTYTIREPKVYVQLNNFSDNDINNTKIYLVNNNNFQYISSRNIYSPNFNIINIVSQGNNDFIPELNTKAFIIENPVSSDTIYDINFSINNIKRKCNTCFLKKDLYDFQEIQNFNFYYKGTQYFEGDTLQIMI